MKTKIKALLIGLVLLIALPLALAQPNNLGLERKETLPFSSEHGAEMRFLQLERSIHSNILRGEMLLNELSDVVSEEALENMEALLESLIMLKEEVSNYEVLGQEEDVKAFVEFMEDAAEVSRQFREEARLNVDETEAENISARVNEEVRNSEERRAYGQAISEKARLHNEEVIQGQLGGEGIVGEDLLERIRNQDIDPKEIREEIMKRVREVRAEEANEVLQRLGEEATRQRINAEEALTRIRTEVTEEQAERVTNMIQQARDRLPETAGNITERIKNINERVQGVMR